MATPLSLIDQAVIITLRGLQGERDVSNVFLVAETGIEPHTLIRILKARREVTIGELKLLATALGTTPAAIVATADARVGSLA